jgi:hypothetical protein
LIQTRNLNIGGQHALPQPQVPPNVILQPHPSIVNVHESSMQPHADGWGGISANPSFGANQWLIDPPPPLVHPTLLIIKNEFMPPLPSRDHKIPLHSSQTDKGK